MASFDEPLPVGLGIGPMRTGSTWLYEYLLSRNDVCLPKGVKETFYFAGNHELGELWYKNHFRHYDPAKHRTILEVCPTLFHNHETIARVRRTLRRPTLMATLRDPVDRTWSHYMHYRQYGETELAFDAAVREFPSMVAASLYARHLARWCDEFGPDAIRITFYDDLKERPSEYVRQVNEVFDLPALPAEALFGRKFNSGALPSNRALAKIARKAAAKLRGSGMHWVVNAGKRFGLSDVVYGRSGGVAPKPVMRADTHDYLVEQFTSDIEDLEKMLNVNLDSWRRRWARSGDKPD